MRNVRAGTDTNYCWISVWLVVDTDYLRIMNEMQKSFLVYEVLFTILIKVACFDKKPLQIIHDRRKVDIFGNIVNSNGYHGFK